MAHSVGEQAARAVKNSERKKVLETRSPGEIIKGIRGNLTAHLAVTPGDIAFLLDRYDAFVAGDAFLRNDVMTAEEMKASQLAVLRDLQEQVVVGFTMTAEQAREAERVHTLLQDHGDEA